VNPVDRSQASPNTKLPVALFCFKRPDLTANVFRAICEYEPRALHVFLDAARPNVPGELQLVEEVKQMFKAVGHTFPIIHHFAEENLGIQESFHRGLLAMAQAHEKFIVLEDDCLPNQEFFDFMTDCLSYFGPSSSVGMVQGLNLNPFSRAMRVRGYLSSRMKIWGWGTWRESVSGFDPSEKPWLHDDASGVLKRAGWNFIERKRFLEALESIDELGTWDYQWVYHLLRQGKYSVSPAGNFIVNLGFGEDSIHTVIPWPSALRSPKPDRATGQLENIKKRVHWIDHAEFYLRTVMDVLYAVRHMDLVVRHVLKRSKNSKG
jgi:hypothetical protein